MLIVILMLVVGLVLGLVGGGGAVLLVPILVYVVGKDVVSATACALFIVGITSLIGSINLGIKKLVDYKIVLLFVLPSMATIYLVRRFLIPAIPDLILEVGTWQLTKHLFIMLLLAVVLIASSYNMIWGNVQSTSKEEKQKINYLLIVAVGILVGIMAGIVGSGGGFMIIPALVMFAGVPMRLAIGTSLSIIAINSLFGFATDVIHAPYLEWNFLLYCSSFTVLGMLAGIYLSNFISSIKLKKTFGFIALATGICILGVEFLR